MALFIEVIRENGKRARFDTRLPMLILESEVRPEKGLRQNILQIKVDGQLITVLGETLEQFWERYANAIGVNTHLSKPNGVVVDPIPEKTEATFIPGKHTVEAKANGKAV